MMDNPFENYGRPVSGNRLIGREEIVCEIYKSLVAGANYSLAGLHRIGKTSIGKEVLSRILKDRPDIRCASITMGTISSEQNLYQEILDELFPDEEYLLASQDAWRDFKRFLRKHSSEKKSVIMLDELDNIRDLDNSELLINRLRELAHEDKYNLSFLFISARTLLSIQDKCRGSNLAGICHKRTIGPFPNSNILSHMVKRANAVSDSTEKLLFSLTGGHPYLSELLLYFSFNLAQDRNKEIDDAIVQDAFAMASNDFLDYYKQLEGFLNDWATDSWKKLCDYTVGPLLEPPDEFLINNFKAYGLLNDNLEAWGDGMSEHLQKYMEHQRRFAPIWPLIGDVEMSLRSLIKKKLQDKYGLNWYYEAVNNDTFYNQLFKELKEIMSKEQKIHGLGNSTDILEYAYPGTLKDIILHEWKLYQQVFNDSKHTFIENMDAIHIIRNPLAHNRSPELISKPLIDKARCACETLQKQLC